jgi:hypothetical protein
MVTWPWCPVVVMPGGYPLWGGGTAKGWGGGNLLTLKRVIPLPHILQQLFYICRVLLFDNRRQVPPGPPKPFHPPPFRVTLRP